MDIALGDTFSLKATAFDLRDPAKVLYEAGTRAVVDGVDGQYLLLRWPDGQVEPTEVGTIMLFFNRIQDGEIVYVHQTTGYGTPPPGLAPFLPPEADWRRNYRVKVIVELEDRGLKTAVCPRCLNDLGPELTINEEGLIECKPCGTFVIPLDPKAFGDEDEQDQSGAISRGG